MILLHEHYNVNNIRLYAFLLTLNTANSNDVNQKRAVC